MIEISVVDEKPQMVAGMRRRGHYKEIAKMLPALFEYVMGRGARIAGPPLYLWHETSVEDAQRADEAGNADIEVCVPIAEKIPENDDIKCYELFGGRMAKIVHKGPYEACGPAYERLFAWLLENDLKLTGPIREAYLNDPREVAPEEILTTIYAPIG
ncbi:MAG: GyrI-like domain-containing protein [Methanothrix sp.]|jgi:effector-binding domain-containing protein|nr:GyrI-like domain-containing protein [Methanothrix sp.]